MVTKAILFWSSLIIFSLLLLVILEPSHILSSTLIGIINDMRWFGYSLFSKDSFSVFRLIFVALVLIILVKAWKGK